MSTDQPSHKAHLEMSKRSDIYRGCVSERGLAALVAAGIASTSKAGTGDTEDLIDYALTHTEIPNTTNGAQLVLLLQIRELLALNYDDTHSYV